MDTEKEIQAEYSPEIFCPKCGYLMEGNGMAQSITLKYFILIAYPINTFQLVIHGSARHL